MPNWIAFKIKMQNACLNCRQAIVRSWYPPQEIRYDEDVTALDDLDADSYEALAQLRIEWMCRPISCGRVPFPKAID